MRDTIYLVGVIARRELLTSLRSGQGLAMLVATTLLLAAGAASAVIYAGADYAAMVASLSFYFHAQTWMLYLAALAAVPGVAAVSMLSERSLERYDSLLVTPIPPYAVILGKYVAVLLYSVLFCAAVLPFTGVLYFFGWVESRHLIEAAWWILPTACCTAAIGIAASAIAATPWEACLRAYPFIMFLLVVRSIPEGLQLILNIAIPPAAFNATCLALITLIAIGHAIYAAPRTAEPPRTQSGGTLPRTPREGFRIIFPAGTTSFPDGANPFGRRCLCGSCFQNRGLRFLLAILTFYLYVCLVAPALSDPAFAILPRAVERSMLVFVPALVALQFVRELDTQTMDANRLTLCRPLELVLGQHIGIARIFLPFLLPALAVRLVLALYLSVTGADATLYWLELVLLPLHLSMAVALALAGASFARTALAAIPLAFAPVLVIGVPYLFLTSTALQPGRTWIGLVIAFTAGSLLPGAVIIGGATALAWVRLRYVWNRRG